MSNIYNTEPPTSGKVVLRTSVGDIDIELWSKEAPLACRNFVQLSLEGYYDGVLVHRVIKDFMLQTGDPTGTGRGGESCWNGRAFKDEPHGRIRFNHRGQVAMAHDGTPHSNQSQFFITLGPCEWLNRKHTVFGKVTGDTIYNVMRLNDVETEEGTDRPVDAHELRIKSVEVLWNPFDDIVPRATKLGSSRSESTSAAESSSSGGRAAQGAPVGSKISAKKDKRLLSFGDFEEEEAGEGEEEEAVVVRGKGKDKGKAESRGGGSGGGRKTPGVGGMRPMQALDEAESGAGAGAGSGVGGKRPRVESDDGEGEGEGRGDERERTGRAAAGVPKAAEDAKNGTASAATEAQGAPTSSASSSSTAFAELRNAMLASRKAVKQLETTGTAAAGGEEAKAPSSSSSSSSGLSLLEQRRLKYSKRTKDQDSRESNTLDRLAQFKQGLEKQKKGHGKEQAAAPAAGAADGDGDGEEDGNWFAGELKFTRHIDDALRNKHSHH